MNQCNQCRSYAINLNQNGRDDTDPDLCDACYWRRRATQAEEVVNRLPKTSDGVPIVPGDSVYIEHSGFEKRVRAVHRDSIAVTTGCIAASLVNVHPHQVYSTRDAVEEARGK